MKTIADLKFEAISLFSSINTYFLFFFKYIPYLYMHFEVSWYFIVCSYIEISSFMIKYFTAV